MFRRVVDGVEWAALAIAVVFVVLMFAYRPTRVVATGYSVSAPSGQAIFAANCATCHGDRGQGGVGPKLGQGQVAARFPNEDDEIAIVTNGEGGMPAWRGTLTPAQIKAVVDYTRTGL
jgi:mono/diheme cytochrome c family protein